ncbi:hypothetical protein [Solirubrum puertoriconensis]|uniref:Secretion system C-terminal sorting domain-containing protein n=1 Tax=Solirubrum puertoriconensis TaxID=1751427 RepID=A0A9X0HNH1_SOLP1|nr:hypothetical protein [Solirubrum puertoriconensis]KUG09302.1 hypothetical protein ASU33_16310 [Solirubrum puertoriconensis]
MKRFALSLVAATLLALPAAHAQTKVKTKTKSETTGTEIKTKSTAEPVVLDGAVKRVETLSGIDIFPKPNSNSVLLSFTQQFTKPGKLTVTDYKNNPIYTEDLDPATHTGAPVDLGHIPAGTYLVEAKIDNYLYWKKVRIKYPSTPVATKKKRGRR